MIFRLFLDDLREPPCDGQLWWIARSFEEAVNAVRDMGMPSFVSFDHDLGVGKTGYDFAHWLVQRDLNGHKLPVDFVYAIHSANPVGVYNIKGLLDRYLEFRVSA